MPAVCAVCTLDHLHYARTLMSSVKAVHPDWAQYVLVIDLPEHDFELAQEPFNIVTMADIEIPDTGEFLFRHNAFQACAAVRPWFLAWIFEATPVDQLVYLDCDCHLYAPMTEACNLLGAGARIVLTPHLIAPMANAEEEEIILQAGSINIGFLALRKDPETLSFLRWWGRHCQFECIIDFARGLYMEQRWLELAAGMFPGVVYLRDPGYNVAHWNIRQTTLTYESDRYMANGRPLVMFHFTGLETAQPETLSKHNRDLRLEEMPLVRNLALKYIARLNEHGLDVWQKRSYRYGRFSDGLPIPEALRAAYRSSDEVRISYGADPFSIPGASLNQPWPVGGDGLVTRLMHDIWRARRDLLKLFPDISAGDRRRFAMWWMTTGKADLDVQSTYHVCTSLGFKLRLYLFKRFKFLRKIV